MSQITPATQSDSLSLREIHSTFNKVAWVVCTYGLGLLFSAILAMSKPITEQSLIAGFVVHPLIIAAVKCGTYLLFPYWLYQRQVVHGIKLSFGWWFVMAIYTGLLGGILILWLFDVLRQIMKFIMKPQMSEQIEFIYNGK